MIETTAHALTSFRAESVTSPSLVCFEPRRFFQAPESQVKVTSLYHQEQEVAPARFWNAGLIQKSRGSVVHRGRSMEPAPSFFQAKSRPRF
jgi:hypothetical protein